MVEIRAILDLLATRRDSPAVLATLVHVEGSSYRRPGARLLWLPDGTRIGSISGGCLEEDLAARAARVHTAGRGEVVTYNTMAENDLVWGTGTGCDGRVDILLEPLPVARPDWIARLREDQAARRDTALAVVHAGDDGVQLGTRLATELAQGSNGMGVFRDTVTPPPALAVFGAGDDARPLVRLAAALGWDVTVLDARAGYATTARFPQAVAVHAVPPAGAAARARLDDRSLAVVMTHRYRDDAILLRDLLTRPLAYLGLLGPRHRTDRLLTELAATGVKPTPEQRARLHAPVGLDLGGSTPETVALAILAEMQAHLTGSGAGFLREKVGAIHG